MMLFCKGTLVTSSERQTKYDFDVDSDYDKSSEHVLDYWCCAKLLIIHHHVLSITIIPLGGCYYLSILQMERLRLRRLFKVTWEVKYKIRI